MRLDAKAIVALVPLLLAAACSPASIAPPSAQGSDGGADADAAPVEAGSDADGGASSIAQACKGYAYARCTRLKSCSPTSIQIEYGSVQTCETYFDGLCTNALHAPSTGSSVSGYEGCTAAVMDPQQWACSDVIYAKNLPPKCMSNGGPLADGTPCAVNQQCKSTFCVIPPGAACGTCGALPKVGDPCPCGPLLICSDGACAALSELGAACGPGAVCDVGLTCVNGTCVAGVATQGAACSFTGAGCDFHAGLACNAVSGTCQTMSVVGPGQACGTVENQLQECIAGTCSRGACAAFPLLGEPCDLVAGPACMAFSNCVVTTDGGTSGTCQLPGFTSCP